MILSLTMVLAAVAAGCGAGQESGSGQGADSPAAQASGSGQPVGFLPDLSVTDVGTGTDVALPSLVPADRPVLLWFWAPH